MRLRCPCGQALQVADALAGWRVLCPACKSVLRVPALSVPSDEAPRREGTADGPGRGDRPTRSALIVAGGVAALVGVLIVAGAGAVMVVLTLLCGLLAVQGLLLGGARMVAALAGMVAALVLAPPVGRLLAGPVRTLFGVPRLVSPVAGTVLVAVLLIGAAVALAGPLGRRILKRHRFGRRVNQWVGFALGAAEGMLLSLFICWGLAMLRPVAQAAARATEARGERHPLAHAVDSAAESAARSLFGRAAEAVNPLRRVGAIRLSAEVALTAAHRGALDAFAKDPAVAPILDRPEVQAMVERLRADEDLMRLVEERDLRGLLDNPTLVEVVRAPALRRLVAEHQEDLLKALERARSSRAPP